MRVLTLLLVLAIASTEVRADGPGASLDKIVDGVAQGNIAAIIIGVILVLFSLCIGCSK
jgi:hypothetical protein